MNIHVYHTSEQVTKAAAVLVASELIENPSAVLGLAGGQTPLDLYDELIDLMQAGVISFADVTALALTEYIGDDGELTSSVRLSLFRALFDHIDIHPKAIVTPNGATAHWARECAAYETTIADLGDIDLLLLGLGENGHIGFNEPGDTLQSDTHVETLTAATRDALAIDFPSRQAVPKRAITMGIGTIMRARRIVLLATGVRKAWAVAAMLDGPIDPHCPASLLQTHPDVTVLVDDEAASELSDNAV